MDKLLPNCGLLPCFSMINYTDKSSRVNFKHLVQFEYKAKKKKRLRVTSLHLHIKLSLVATQTHFRKYLPAKYTQPLGIVLWPVKRKDAPPPYLSNCS